MIRMPAPLHVLIVDDSAVMRRMVARVLRLSRVPLGSVREAADGAEALRAIAERRVDLVLLDVNMPVLDGEQTLRRLRADPATAALPVIVVSTESSATRVDALAALGAAFVHKPFAPEDLRAPILRITGVPAQPYDESDALPLSAALGRGFDF